MARRSMKRSVAMTKAMAVLLTSLFTIVLVIVVLLTNTARRGGDPVSSGIAAAQEEGVEEGVEEEASTEAAASAVEEVAQELAAQQEPGGAAIPGVRVFGDCGAEGAAESRDAPGSLSDDVPSRYPSTRPWSEYRRRLKATYLSSRAAGWGLTIESALQGLC
jgi:hypothetical protein